LQSRTRVHPQFQITAVDKALALRTRDSLAPRAARLD